jgi:copper chaperone
MSSKILHIPEISCQHCLNNIKGELAGMPGVVSISGDVAAKNIVIDWQQPANLSDILSVLNDIGYPADES